MISEGVTGNLGTVFSGPNQAEAIDTCNLHVAQSMFIGSLPMALIADAFNWSVAMGGGAAMFLRIVVGLGLYRTALRQLRV